jgi:hypothetical protein
VRTVGVGYGLMGIDSQSGLIPHGQDPHDVMWNLQTGLTALGRYLAAPYWKTALMAFHARVQAPPGWTSSGYADQIRSLIESYDAGPQLGAWALAPWSHKTGQWEDPGHRPEWVFVIGTAPVGATGQHAWKPPTIEHVCSKGRCTTLVIRHILHYVDLGQPIQVWGTIASGQHVTFALSTGNPNIPVWSGGVVWGAKVPLTGKDALTSITARWANGQIDTIPWPEGGGSSGAVVWHLLTNPQTLRRWWPDIQIAAQQAGSNMPSLNTFEDAIGAVMLHESGGIPNLWADGVVGGAYGLMQLELATAQRLPGYYPGARHNPQENLILGAELLAELYHQTGSWHMTFAEYYYGSPPPGYQPGMTWTQVAALYNFVPAGGNTETVTAYADQMVAEMHAVAQEAPKS